MNLNILSISKMITSQADTIAVLVCLNIVLLSVIILYLIFWIVVPRVNKFRRHRKENRPVPVNPEKYEAGNEEADKAAIAMALYLYFNEMHDEESDVITIKRVSKTYSPWSSKLYSMRSFR